MTSLPTTGAVPGSSVSPGAGAYGVVWAGPELPEDLLLTAPTGTPRLGVQVSADAPAGREELDDQLGDDRAHIELPGGGWVRVDREPLVASLHLPRPHRPTELAHPYLASACAVAAHWRGALTFHAGAVAVDGAAWGVIGGKGAGKSTTLAALAQAGLPVLCDDLLILERGRALAGPRCIDLRRSAAEHFPESEALGVVGERSRWRLPIAPAPWSVPMAGWLQLDWGDELALEPLDARERIHALSAAMALVAAPSQPRALLDAAALPVLRLRRVRALDRLGELVEAIGGLAARSAAG